MIQLSAKDTKRERKFQYIAASLQPRGPFLKAPETLWARQAMFC